MTRHHSANRVSLTHLAPQRPLGESLADDVRQGLTGSAKSLPPIYFSDALGSELFEQITGLDEYYPTRAESEILARASEREGLLTQIAATLKPTDAFLLGIDLVRNPGVLVRAYDDAEQIEMHLVGETDVRCHLAAIDLELNFAAHDHIVTEHSHKFRIAPLRRELARVGLHVSQVMTDSLDRFAVILAQPTRTQRR